MIGSEPPVPAGPPAPESLSAPKSREHWWRHPNGRWIIEDAGRQAEILALPAAGRAGTRPDTVIDGGRLNGITFRATSQRGLGHQQLGTPRQDAYLVRPTPDRRWLVGCVADGVSEAKLSHEAADMVCQETTSRLARALSDVVAVEAAGWDDIAMGLPWQEAIDAASVAVSQAARQAVRERLVRGGDDDELREFDERAWGDDAARKVMSSTAVIFVVDTMVAPGAGHAAAIAVAAGDSAALLLSGGEWSPMSAVKNAGSIIASSAVEPLPRGVHVRPRAFFLESGQTLAVVTDGLGDPLGSGGGVVGSFLATMWRTPPDLLEFAQQVAFYRKTFTDDRTAVVIWSDVEH
jgi:hypothetical protein